MKKLKKPSDDEILLHEAAVKGFRQHMAEGLTSGLVTFRYQPGKEKSRRIKNESGSGYHMTKKEFIPNPHYPDGVMYSIPAWLGALGGGILLMRLLNIKGFNLGGSGWYPFKTLLDALGISEALEDYELTELGVGKKITQLDENEKLRLINAYRKEQGLEPVTLAEYRELERSGKKSGYWG